MVHGRELIRSLLPTTAHCAPCDERLQALPVWLVAGVAATLPGGALLDACAPHTLRRRLQLH